MRRKASELENKIPPKEFTPIVYNSEQVRIKQILDILIRICDACHDMQGETEPWASIRKDIEKLR